MATYKIWCGVDRVEDRQYLATVSAIPSSGEGRVESESRVLPTRSEADAACIQMVTALSDRLQRRGDAVCD